MVLGFCGPGCPSSTERMDDVLVSTLSMTDLADDIRLYGTMRLSGCSAHHGDESDGAEIWQRPVVCGDSGLDIMAQLSA
jgi:hypothetical protein